MNRLAYVLTVTNLFAAKADGAFQCLFELTPQRFGFQTLLSESGHDCISSSGFIGDKQTDKTICCFSSLFAAQLTVIVDRPDTREVTPGWVTDAVTS
jgi:hypothetical protein